MAYRNDDDAALTRAAAVIEQELEQVRNERRTKTRPHEAPVDSTPAWRDVWRRATEMLPWLLLGTAIVVTRCAMWMADMRPTRAPAAPEMPTRMVVDECVRNLPQTPQLPAEATDARSVRDLSFRTLGTNAPCRDDLHALYAGSEGAERDALGQWVVLEAQLAIAIRKLDEYYANRRYETDDDAHAPALWRDYQVAVQGRDAAAVRWHESFAAQQR